MAASDDFHARFVTLRDGPVVPAPAYLLLLNLEARGFSITRDGPTLVVHPPDQLTGDDCAAIRQWKRHLISLLDYCARPDNDSHLFSDDPEARHA